MGRGLSDLQRFILKRASKQERVYYAEVLRDFFGWTPMQTADWKRGKLDSPGHHSFSPQQIGKATYRNTLATLSRACRRLEKRGLVERLNGAYSLWAAVKALGNPDARGKPVVRRSAPITDNTHTELR
jgi:hypothetical protein